MRGSPYLSKMNEQRPLLLSDMIVKVRADCWNNGRKLRFLPPALGSFGSRTEPARLLRLGASSTHFHGDLHKLHVLVVSSQPRMELNR